MNDDPLMRVMRNIKTSPGPGVGEAIDKSLPPYASQADPLRKAPHKEWIISADKKRKWRFKPDSKMVRDPEGCADCGLNYCHCIEEVSVDAVLARSPAPQGEGMREALEAAATVAENWQHTLIESCPNHMPVYPSIFFRDKAVADAIRALANTPKFMSAAHIPSDRAGREEEIARECARRILGFEPKDNEDGWSAANRHRWKIAVDTIASALRQSDRAGIERAAEWCFNMEIAPCDGTLLLLQVDYSEADIEGGGPLENEVIARTIGWNNRDHDGEDIWKFAGWNWDNDYWPNDGGSGRIIAWMLFPARSLSPSASPVASTPAEPNPPGSGPVAQSFPQPNRNRIGQQPCGECHIQPGETCDICGAAEPFAWRNKPPIASEPWTITTDREMVQMRKADGWLVEPLYAAPLPSPSEGAVRPGLIAAAEHLDASADQIKDQAGKLLAVGTDECKEQAAELAIIEPCLRAEANYLRARATATGGGDGL